MAARAIATSAAKKAVKKAAPAETNESEEVEEGKVQATKGYFDRMKKVNKGEAYARPKPSGPRTGGAQAFKDRMSGKKKVDEAEEQKPLSVKRDALGGPKLDPSKGVATVSEARKGGGAKVGESERSGHRVTKAAKSEPEHIVMQLRKVVSLGKKHEGVTFADGSKIPLTSCTISRISIISSSLISPAFVWSIFKSIVPRIFPITKIIS